MSDLGDRFVADHRTYTRSFIKIRDQDVVDGERFARQPVLRLNPTFRAGRAIDDPAERKFATAPAKKRRAKR